MKRYWYLIDSCLIALLLASGVTTFLKKNKEVAHASQPSLGDGTWDTYTTARGLPSNQVRGGVVVDDNGRIWAGFEKGSLSNPYNEIIGRFDGITWTNYFLPGCMVEEALLANGDDIYAGTRCGGPHSNQGYGLHWFVDGSWVDFMPGDGMEGTYLRAIAAEGENKVWFSAGYTDICRHYVNLLDHKGTADKADDEWTVYDFYATWGICTVSAIAIDPEGNRWFGTSNDVRVLTSDNNWVIHNEVDFGGDFAFDEYGNVWVGQTDSVFQYNGSSWIEYTSDEEAIESNFTAIMTSIDKEQINGSNSSLWAVEKPAGLWILNRFQDVRFYNGENWIIYTPDNSGLSSDHIEGIAVDHQGNVWIATDVDQYGNGGLNKFIPFPDYSLQVVPTTIFLERGQETAVNVNITHLRGWVPTATLTVTGLHPKVTAVFSTNPVTPTAQVQMTLTSTQSAPIGTYYFDLIAATGDGLTRTVNLTLHIVEELFQDYYPAVFKR